MEDLIGQDVQSELQGCIDACLTFDEPLFLLALLFIRETPTIIERLIAKYNFLV